MNTTLTPSLLVKLASLVAHVQEASLLSPAFDVDWQSCNALADDPEVVAWIATIDPVLLPERRS